MSNETIALGILCIFFASGFFVLLKKISSLEKKSSDSFLQEWLKSMQSSLDSTNKTLHESLSHNSSHMVKTLQENSKQLNQRLDRAAEVIKEVSGEVGKMNEIGRNMRELQEFLKSPKLRGNIGEQVLKDLITQMFPKQSFFLQYEFSSGEKVDAAIKTDAGILPIDSKFPMENFQKMMKLQNNTEEFSVLQKDFFRDIKKHIESIAKKYILPQEGTMNFALMYVPSESVYYEIINTEEIMEYAKTLRVYIVSPSTLYAHLQTILLSFEGRKIEKKSQEILSLFHALQIDFQKIEDNLSVLGKHIHNASSQFSQVNETVHSMGKKLQSSHTLEELEKKLS